MNIRLLVMSVFGLVLSTGNAVKSQEVDLKGLPSTAHLMNIAFPSSKEGKCQVKLPEAATRQPGNFQLKAVACAPLDSEWMVLVAHAVPVDEDNEPMYSFEGVLLNLIWFKQAHGQWERAGHEKNIATIGSNDSLGQVTFHPLSTNRLIMSIDARVQNRSRYGTWLYLYELSPEKSRCLANGIPISSNNLDDWMVDICSSVEGKWSFVKAADLVSGSYPEVIVDFAGKELHFTGDPKSIEETDCSDPGWEVSKTIKEQVIYAYANGGYIARKGTNPVRSIF